MDTLDPLLTYIQSPSASISEPLSSTFPEVSSLDNMWQTLNAAKLQGRLLVSTAWRNKT